MSFAGRISAQGSASRKGKSLRDLLGIDESEVAKTLAEQRKATETSEVSIFLVVFNTL